MLHVTIKDTTKNEVIFDDEVSAIAMQAVGRKNITRLRYTVEDADPLDTLSCHNALMAEASEVKNLFSKAFDQAFSQIGNEGGAV